ncbi:MAG: type II toxin-antitoxin system VapC family toxin [Janthinobacterium lividum]
MTGFGARRIKLFVDASAFVAMLADEPERERLVDVLGRADEPLWSAMACWEAISGLRSSHRWTIDAARSEIELLVGQLPFRLVAIGEDERVVALDAYRAFGKRSGHRAQLNMGDCFAYACAKTSDSRLLYKGDDFIHTDLA